MGVPAAVAEPARFQRLVLVGPSPRYLDDEGYVGGFRRFRSGHRLVDGPGVPADDRERVFERYFRGDPSAGATFFVDPPGAEPRQG